MALNLNERRSSSVLTRGSWRRDAVDARDERLVTWLRCTMSAFNASGASSHVISSLMIATSASSIIRSTVGQPSSLSVAVTWSWRLRLATIRAVKFRTFCSLAIWVAHPAPPVIGTCDPLWSETLPEIVQVSLRKVQNGTSLGTGEGRANYMMFCPTRRRRHAVAA